MSDPTPTADEIARWAERHVDGDGECWTCEQPWPCEPSRLLALVAAQAEQIARLESAFSHTAAEWRDRCQAQAEQIAELRGEAEEAFGKGLEQIRRRAERAEAELAALHATDDFQRWARAVVERDAAREAVGRVRALHTPNDPPSSTYAKECMGCDGYWPCETARALEGDAP